MRNYLIEKTQREGLIYSSAISLKYNIAKLLNIKNFLFRKSKIAHYLETHPVVKVHFGAGSGTFGEAAETSLGSFLDTDILGAVPVDITRKLPFDDGTVDVIFSSHLVEHIYHRQFKKYLKDTFRILKKDGKQIVVTPSLEKLCLSLYRNESGEKEMLYKTHQGRISEYPLTPAMVINAMTHINYGHKFLYDYETMQTLGLDAGYGAVQKVEYNEIADNEVAGFLKNKGIGYHAESEVFVLEKP
jgi:predicted SAM-dependent methyltransferase